MVIRHNFLSSSSPFEGGLEDQYIEPISFYRMFALVGAGYFECVNLA